MTDETADPDRVEEVSAEDAPAEDVSAENADETTGAAGGDGDTGTRSEDAAEVDVAARVSEYDDELAAEVRKLQSRVTHLESELEDREERIEELEGVLARTQADFKNYKKRSKKKQDQIRERATEDFVERVVSVRDNLVRALDQEKGADIRPGVQSTLDEFDRILESENVSVINPGPGQDVDPQRHEVMMRVDSDHPEGTIVNVFQPGYEMADRVIRAAQVTVSSSDEA